MVGVPREFKQKRGQQSVRNGTPFDFSARALALTLPRLASEIEPIAAVGDPPTGAENRNGSAQCPPERKNAIGRETQNRESGPEDLPLHVFSLPLPIGIPMGDDGYRWNERDGIGGSC